ncbi:spliceosome ATPase-activating subunit SPP2 [Aspergillus mulundensis]|uniref:Pre-mRNA-splicing factor n=1 Tax=Aspergillus mulundensis TaxID=1810919 RepID=A0A3D8Q8G0_9EURO|nr:Pre-mRNA-splicing factor spp2 [Aspergillus mulundensis]RDW57947.1 Pre-mRNA-splicing factor spp2 [Aspergillus mulundensis]
MSSNTPPDGGKTNGIPIKPVSLSLGSSKAAPKKPAPSATLVRRPHRSLQHHGDSDSDSDGGDNEPAFESVTGFDTLTGKTIGASTAEEKQPLTIPVASGNNWRDRPGVVRRPKSKKNLLPKEVQALQEAQRKGEVPGDGDAVGPSMEYGLSFAKQSQPQGEEGATDQKMEDAAPVAAQPAEETKPLTEDEIALRALVGESKGEVERRSDLVIESRRAGEEEDEEEEYYDGHNNETRSFRADVAARPEPATLDQYNAIPVEEFGAALLRGMGWKEGQAVGKGNYGSGDSSRASTPHVPARRPGFLGIGAKDVSNGKSEVEFGAWGKAAMRKGARKAGEPPKNGESNTEGVYMPVLMRNKKTGETITEEELSVMAKEAKKREDSDDWKERRDRNLERSGRDKDRHRDRDRDRDTRRLEYDDDDRYEGRRNGSSRRDRSRSTSDRHSRRRRYEDEDGEGREDRYYRERDRDRERRSDRDRDRDRDRRSQKYYDDDRHSSRHSSSKESSRHRDRDRDRDSDRDSHRRRR